MLQEIDFERNSIALPNSKAREWRHESDTTQTNKREWQKIWSFLQARKSVFLNKHFLFLTRTLPIYISSISLITRLYCLTLAGFQ